MQEGICFWIKRTSSWWWIIFLTRNVILWMKQKGGNNNTNNNRSSQHLKNSRKVLIQIKEGLLVVPTLHQLLISTRRLMVSTIMVDKRVHNVKSNMLDIWITTWVPIVEDLAQEISWLAIMEDSINQLIKEQDCKVMEMESYLNPVLVKSNNNKDPKHRVKWDQITIPMDQLTQAISCLKLIRQLLLQRKVLMSK